MAGAVAERPERFGGVANRPVRNAADADPQAGAEAVTPMPRRLGEIA